MYLFLDNFSWLTCLSGIHILIHQYYDKLLNVFAFMTVQLLSISYKIFS